MYTGKVLLLLLLYPLAVAGQTNLKEARQLLEKGEYEKAAGICTEKIKTGNEVGKAHLLLGDVFFASRKACYRSAFGQTTVAILAYHAYEKAIKTNGKLTKEAKLKLQQLCPYLPAMEQIFNRSMDKGDEIEVKCWGMTTILVTRNTCEAKYGK